jgi:TP901 family phage tail tape measure protein
MASTRDLTFAIKFRTQSSAAIKKAAKDIRSAAAAAKTADVASKKAAVSAITMGKSFKAAGVAMRRFGVAARTSFSRVRTEIFRVQSALLALGVAFGLTAVVAQIKNFELAMAKVRAIASKGKETMSELSIQFEALTITARRLGATTQFTATQVAGGLQLLVQAGFQANEAVAAIEGTLNLAIAASTDLATATTITANSIRGFGLQAKESGRVADILTAATQNSNTTIELLGEALKFAAPAARAAGQSIESTAAALSVLADSGLKGTLAGTGLRRVLVGLLNPTKKAQVAFQNLGFDIKNLVPGGLTKEGGIRSLVDIIEELAKSTFGAREAFAAFGLRGGPAALVLVATERLTGKFRELNDIIEDSEGRALKFRKIIEGTLFGAMKLLNSRIEALALSQGALADGIERIIRFWADIAAAMNGTLSVTDENTRAAREWANTLIVLGKAIVFLVKMLPLFIAAMIGAKIVMIGLAAGATTLLAGLKALAVYLVGFAAATGIGLVVVAIGIAIFKMFEWRQEIKRSEEATKNWQARLEKAMATARKFHLTPEGGGFKDEEDRAAAATVLKQSLKDYQGYVAELEATYINAQDNIAKKAQESMDLQARILKGGLDGVAAHWETRLREMFIEAPVGLFQAIGEVFRSGSAEDRDLDERIAIGVARAKAALLEIEVKITTEIIEQRELLRQLAAEQGTAAARIAEDFQLTISRQNAAYGKAFKKAGVELDILKLKAIGTKDALADAASLEFRRDNDLLDQTAFADLRQFIESQEESLLLLRLRKKILEDARGQQDDPEDESNEKLELRIASNQAIQDTITVTQDLARAEILVKEAERDALELRLLEIQAMKDLRNERKKAQKASFEFLKFRQRQLETIRTEIAMDGLSVKAKRRLKGAIDLVTEATKRGVKVEKEWLETLSEGFDELEAHEEAMNTFSQGFDDAMEEMIESAENFREQGKEIFEDMFSSLEDLIVDFVDKGELNFREFAASIRRTLIKTAVKDLMGQAMNFIRGEQPDAKKEAEEAILRELTAQREILEEQMRNTPTFGEAEIKAQLIIVNDSIRALMGLGPVGSGGPAGAGTIVGDSHQGDIMKVANLGLDIFKMVGREGIIPSLAGGTRRTSAGMSSNQMRRGLGLESDAIPAILHPNEAVIPLTSGGGVPLIEKGGKLAIGLPGGRSVPVSSGSTAGRAKRNFSSAGRGVNPFAFAGAPRGYEGGLSAMFMPALTAIGGALSGFFTGIPGFFGDTLGFGSFFGSISTGISDAFTNVSDFGKELFGIGATATNNVAAAESIKGGGAPRGSTLAAAQSVDTITTAAGRGWQIDSGVKKSLSEGIAEKKTSDASFGQNALKTVQYAALIAGIGQQLFAGLGGSGGNRVRATGRVLGLGNQRPGEHLSNEERAHLEKMAALGRKAIRTGKAQKFRLGGVTGFAEGGIVNQPTLGMVGEGGSPEAIIPLKGGAVPVRLEGGSASAAGGAVTVNFNVNTPDADSFRAAQPQIESSLARGLNRAANRAHDV